MINLQYSVLQTPLPPFVYRGIEEYCRSANRYHFHPKELISKLAEKHDIPEQFIHLSSGSNESILAFIQSYGKNITIFTPTYKEYGRRQPHTASLNEVWSEVAGRYRISTASRPKNSLIFLANPNNPFGYTLQATIIELIENNTDSLIVVDEAYSKFFNESMLDYVRNYDNLAVLRSFSKDYAMAGCRIGYVVAHPDVISKIRESIQETNVSYLSVGAAITALDNESYFDGLIDEVVRVRDNFCAFLSRKNINFMASSINAVLLRFDQPRRGKDFYNYLQHCGVNTSLGNGNSNIGLDESYVRITVGTSSQMARVSEYISGYSP